MIKPTTFTYLWLIVISDGCVTNNINLAGGLEHGFYFPFHIWDVILPIDFHIFQRGRYTTSQYDKAYYFYLSTIY